MFYLLIYVCGVGASYLFVSGRASVQLMLDSMDEGMDHGRAVGATVLFGFALIWPLMLPSALYQVVRQRL